MSGYYAQRLAAERLDRCYALAPPRMQRYLEAEVQHACRLASAQAVVLELGCGTGRIAARLAQSGAQVVGIDVAESSLRLARARAQTSVQAGSLHYVCMDALALGFRANCFDLVLCAQNGVGAFQAELLPLARESWRVLRPGGWLAFSTYTEAIWPDRLDWFERQAAQGLVGAIDRVASRAGTIVARDGFRSGRTGVAEFEALAHALGVEARLHAVDDSSLWCEMRKPPTGWPEVRAQAA